MNLPHVRVATNPRTLPSGEFSLRRLQDHQRLRLRSARAAQHRLWPVLVVALLVMQSATPLLAQMPSSNALSPEEELGRLQIWANRLARVSFSPDGGLIALAVRDRKGAHFEPPARTIGGQPGAVARMYRGLDLWVANSVTGAVTRLTDGHSANWSPTWSPDGGTLAFISDRDGSLRVWLWERSSGRVRLASRLVVDGFVAEATVQWLPDGQHLVVRAPDVVPEADLQTTITGLAGASELSSEEANVQVFQGLVGDSAVLARVYSRDLALEGLVKHQPTSGIVIIDVVSGDVRHIVTGVRPSAYWLSPSGTAIAFATMDTSDTDGVRSCDINIVDLHGRKRTIARSVRQSACRSVSWSPAGDMIAYASSDAHGVVRAYVAKASGGSPHLLTPGSHAGLQMPADGGPQWDPAGGGVFLLSRDTVWHAAVDGQLQVIGVSPTHDLLQIMDCTRSKSVWSPDDGRSIFIFARDARTMRIGVLQMNIATGKSELSFESDQWFQLRGGVDCLGKAVVYVAESATASPDLWIADSNFAGGRQLTELNPILERHEFGTARLIEWMGLRGEYLRGILILPAPYDSMRRYPLVVSLYGGYRPESHLNTFGLVGTAAAGPLNLQLLATRGYAVLVPDAIYRPGGSLMFDLAASVLPGVNRVIELGIADPDRIGITGLSFGGYSALALAALAPRFKAVVIRGGFGDMSTYAATAIRPSDGHGGGFVNAERVFGMGGTVWEQRDRYIENSPYYYLDRVGAAVLVVHGANDDTVEPALADQTYSALRRLGKTVEYARYLGEGHGEALWNYSDARDELHRILGWFDRYLKQ